MVLGFGVDRSGLGSGGRAHARETPKGSHSGLGPPARVASQARRVPPVGGEGTNRIWPGDAAPPSAELEVQAKAQGQRGEIGSNLSRDPAGRPAMLQHCG